MSNAKIVRDNSNAGGGMVYCLGFIGALVYFWQRADSFWMFVLGLIKSIVWPAILIYKTLDFFKL